MAKPIFIVGAGGLGLEMLAMLKSFPEYTANGFYDDHIENGAVVHGLVCLGTINELAEVQNETYVIIAIGEPSEKKLVIDKIRASKHIHFPSFIHPTAILLNEKEIKIGRGTIITAGVVLTTHIQIGDFVLINLNSTIGHHVQVYNFTSIMPGVNVAGKVSIDEAVLIGSGANVLNGLTIGSQAKVGSGAVVTKDVEANQTVVGIPAKPLTK
jgi:sugar O-acyltransferase (sialic acid O-acetyltransferase NeuD family)